MEPAERLSGRGEVYLGGRMTRLPERAASEAD